MSQGTRDRTEHVDAQLERTGGQLLELLLRPGFARDMAGLAAMLLVWAALIWLVFGR